MNRESVRIDNHLRPVALNRSSPRMVKDNKPVQAANHYMNVETQLNMDSTYLCKATSKSIMDSADKTNCTELFNDTELKKDLYLSTLVDEYQTSLNRKDCDNTKCYRFKILSYRISQSLLEKIKYIKNDLQAAKKNTTSTKSSSFNSPQSQHYSYSVLQGDDRFSEKKELLDLIKDKDRCIQDLEKLVDDQKRLRVQDASKVEEKAARIKEWVTNKLKELENQNKHLRDQNKKQKEVIESLTNQLADSSPEQILNRVPLDKVNFIDQTCSLETIEGERSMKFRPTHLKNQFQNKLSSSEDEHLGLRVRSELEQTKIHKLVDITGEEISDLTRIEIGGKRDVLLERKSPRNRSSSNRCDSPVYDSVTIEQLNRRNLKATNHATLEDSVQSNNNLDSYAPLSSPPPPPLHQSDKWELQLYDLAEQTFSTLIKQKNYDQSCSQPESLDSFSNSEKETTHSRKSSSSNNDLNSLMKPSFTTISGDIVVDNLNNEITNNSLLNENAHHPTSLEFCENGSILSPIHLKTMRKPSNLHESIEKPSTPNLFDSPLRSRAGKDSILRTQSVRRNPAPERLYDFIVADLTKRGYLVKHGAIKNHNRWFVLKNFHLYSYKNESEEVAKATPNIILKLSSICQVSPLSQTGESSFPFKISFMDKNWQFIADSATNRDEWVRLLTVAINMSDVEAETLTKNNATHDGLVSVTRNGHTKRCYATLINHVIFFLKSLTDPTPINYLSVKGAKIREIIDNFDYDLEEHELLKQKSSFQECSLAIYPRYSLNLDPVYLTLAGQQETDKWFYFLSSKSGIDQSSGTQFEQTLTRLMINNSLVSRSDSSGIVLTAGNGTVCSWKDYSVILYSGTPITQPLTSLPNETLRIEAVELFKSLLLFTQVPIEPIAIEYHVSLMQNCFDRFLKHPELRNEFFAQLIKQCTYVLHRCQGQRSSSGSSGCSVNNQRSSIISLSPTSSECQFITDSKMLDSILQDRAIKLESTSNLPLKLGNKDKTENYIEDMPPPSQSELLQVMQILAIAVSLNLPRGRMRWWLMDYLRKFASADTNIGKYAFYTLRAIERTIANGPRENIPSRTEIMSILLRNPFDHSNPHSLPINFSDGSYLVIEADGSTTVEEFMSTMMKNIDIRHSLISDFYLFADDPSGSKDLYILEPQRKVLDIVGWWEQVFRKQNSGRFQNMKSIKLVCKKRLVLRSEEGETYPERLLIVHQLSQEVASNRIPMSENLILELAAIMAQLTYGDYEKSKDPKLNKCILQKVFDTFLLNNKSSQTNDHQDIEVSNEYHNELITRWLHLSGKSAQDCVRVYLNCIRRMKLNDK